MRSRLELPAELRSRRGRPFILAHRGCRAQAPENTVAAFDLALEQGADAIETDLRITRDGVIVCIHDETVDRTTNGSGRVDQMTWSEIRGLRALGNSAIRYPDVRVPTLVETLEALVDRTYLALELKAPAFAQAADVELLLKTLDDCGALDRVIALSFSQKALGCLEEVGAPFPLGYIAATNPWPPGRYPLVGPWWPLLFFNPFYIAISHRRGQICCPLDPSPEPRLGLYLRLKVDGLLSDDPSLTRSALEASALGQPPSDNALGEKSDRG